MFGQGSLGCEAWVGQQTWLDPPSQPQWCGTEEAALFLPIMTDITYQIRKLLMMTENTLCSVFCKITNHGLLNEILQSMQTAGTVTPILPCNWILKTFKVVHRLFGIVEKLLEEHMLSQASWKNIELLNIKWTLTYLNVSHILFQVLLHTVAELQDPTPLGLHCCLVGLRGGKNKPVDKSFILL